MPRRINGVTQYYPGEKLPSWADKKKALKTKGTEHFNSYVQGSIAWAEKKRRR